MTFRELEAEGIRVLTQAGKQDAEFDARQLLLFATSASNTDLPFLLSLAAPEAVRYRFSELIDRRVSGEPLQYILGVWDFYGCEFLIGSGVLIPRQDTESLVEISADEISDLINGGKTPVVFDLCTGCGAIGLVLAKKYPSASVYCFDLYDLPLYYAGLNVVKLGLDNAKVIKADVLSGKPDGLPEPDVIVSNPPYVISSELSGLEQEVLAEPLTALDGGDDGMLFYNAITGKWLPYLKDGGFVCFESYVDEAASISELLSDRFDVTQKTVFSTRVVITSAKLRG